MAKSASSSGRKTATYRLLVVPVPHLYWREREREREGLWILGETEPKGLALLTLLTSKNSTCRVSIELGGKQQVPSYQKIVYLSRMSNIAKNRL
jgi:hypothetical protein